MADISISSKQRRVPMVDRRQKVVKPRLPRKITSSCIININKFWTELEDFYVGKTSNKVISFAKEATVEEMENSINENIERERQGMTTNSS